VCVGVSFVSACMLEFVVVRMHVCRNFLLCECGCVGILLLFECVYLAIYWCVCVFVGIYCCVSGVGVYWCVSACVGVYLCVNVCFGVYWCVSACVLEFICV